MSPIAPRYRGPEASSDDSQTTLNPIFTIPNMTPLKDDVVTYHETLSDVTQAAEGESYSEPDPVERLAPEPSRLQPILDSMQDSIKRITDTARKSVKRASDRNQFNPVETVRGVLPGIVISISIICLWWIIGRSSPAPLRPNVARESQGHQEKINPIASDPLRVAEQINNNTPDEAPTVAADSSADEQLFDQVPFINRPTNETVSQSDTTQEAPSTAPPANDGPQADTRPEPSQSSFPPASQSEIAEAQPNPRSSTGRADVRRPNDTGREPVRVADRSTEFEWDRGSPRQNSNPRRERNVEQRRDQPTTAQRSEHNRMIDERRPQRTYSYQQTDPSTYTDPVYNVPPVARRARAAQR